MIWSPMVQWAEGSHRLLKDHADLLAADGAHLRAVRFKLKDT
jgi:hypothetical protein